MSKKTLRPGKASESIVFGALLQEGMDVYPALVDDQGIDAVLRSPNGKFYWDVQIKSSASWQGIRAWSDIDAKSNYILILFNSEKWEIIWLPWSKLKRYFPATGYDWGDVFLNNAVLDKLRKEGFDKIEKLRKYVNTAKF